MDLKKIRKKRQALNRDLFWDREMGGSHQGQIQMQLAKLADIEDRFLFEHVETEDSECVLA